MNNKFFGYLKRSLGYYCYHLAKQEVVISGVIILEKIVSIKKWQSKKDEIRWKVIKQQIKWMQIVSVMSLYLLVMWQK